MKLSDYVFDFIANLGTDRVFMIVGGANTHLADSLSLNKKLKYVCFQHEQAAVMAAEGYSRTSGKIGVVLVTSGPGGTNAITGVTGAWCDSVPLIVISGQVALHLTTDGKTIRQLGVQQINIADLVKPITKYAVMINDPNEIRYHLEKAAYLATNGRPGPVWLDIPIDIQRADIEPQKIKVFKSRPLKKHSQISEQISKTLELIKTAQRPVLILGHGIRIAKGKESAQKLVEKLQFPVITTWNGIDLINHEHPLYIGSAGVMGQRGANFAVANSDLILSIGSRLDTRQVGNSSNLYARAAKKIVVDVDETELNKKLIKIDVPIVSDAKKFIDLLLESLSEINIPNVTSWTKKCQEWKNKYPVILPEYQQENNGINSYAFIETLCRHLGEKDIVVTDMGTSFTCTMQTFKVCGKQRLFTNSGFASMGFGLPAVIGAYFGKNSGQNKVIGVFGDGGFQMNIQELQTIAHYQIPLKIFILNNGCYLTIKHTQEEFFEGNYVGSEPQSGYSAPAFCKIAQAYNIANYRVLELEHLNRLLPFLLEADFPILCEIKMPNNQPLIPLSILDRSKGYTGSPIERMFPFLPEEEFLENMIIPAV